MIESKPAADIVPDEVLRRMLNTPPKPHKPDKPDKPDKPSKAKKPKTKKPAT